MTVTVACSWARRGSLGGTLWDRFKSLCCSGSRWGDTWVLERFLLLDLDLDLVLLDFLCFFEWDLDLLDLSLSLDLERAILKREHRITGGTAPYLVAMHPVCPLLVGLPLNSGPDRLRLLISEINRTQMEYRVLPMGPVLSKLARLLIGPNLGYYPKIPLRGWFITYRIIIFPLLVGNY